jgi:dipeptidyl aminopeptidase/acylaminoacyl peptidase
MRPDGSDVHRLTDSPGLDEGPVWSPDGTKIAFSSARDGQQEIYVMNADGSDQRRLTNNPARDESPDWQPLPFDDRGHTACGDVSLASGGASSVAALDIACGAAKRRAQRWTKAAHAGAPPAKLAGLRCTTDPRAYDLVVVQCDRKRRGIAFVWRHS